MLVYQTNTTGEKIRSDKKEPTSLLFLPPFPPSKERGFVSFSIDRVHNKEKKREREREKEKCFSMRVVGRQCFNRERRRRDGKRESVRELAARTTEI